ncbi:hypothetical protein ACYJ1Y_18015 [Natrialbaceae archaeon A-gly3]
MTISRRTTLNHTSPDAPADSEEPEESEPANDVVATLEVDLDPGTAYSAYAIGYLEAPADADGREFDVRLEIDGPLANLEVPEEPEDPDDEQTESLTLRWTAGEVVSIGGERPSERSLRRSQAVSGGTTVVSRQTATTDC